MGGSHNIQYREEGKVKSFIELSELVKDLELIIMELDETNEYNENGENDEINEENNENNETENGNYSGIVIENNDYSEFV